MKYFGLIIGGLSGSIGGITGSHNKGGVYIRARAIPTNPNSVRQQATRNAFALWAGNWTNALTQEFRDQWNTYAQNHTIEDALGQDIHINGISWYIMLNSRLFDAGFGTNSGPPPGAEPGGYTTFTVDISALNTVDVTFSAAHAPTEAMQLWMTLPGTAGQTPNFKQARLVGYSPLEQASPWAATLPFAVVSGTQSTFYGKRMNANGQVSVPLVDTDLADY
jgi:hypothetical protein